MSEVSSGIPPWLGRRASTVALSIVPDGGDSSGSCWRLQQRHCFENRRHTLREAAREFFNGASGELPYPVCALNTSLLLLDSIAEQVSARGLASFQSGRWQAVFVDRTLDYPDLQSTLLIDKRGQLLVGATLPFPPPNVNYFDRDYFQAHAGGQDLVETIPADHGNHCVAVVKLSDGTMMPPDPTWVPFCRELWSSAEQQQNYLPGTPEGTDLCLTPISDPENHYVRIKAQNTLDEKGTLKGTFTIEAEGQSDSNIRRIFTTGFQSEWAHTMERQLLNVSPKSPTEKCGLRTDTERLPARPHPDYVPLRDSGICAERRPRRNDF